MHSEYMDGCGNYLSENARELKKKIWEQRKNELGEREEDRERGSIRKYWEAVNERERKK